MMTMRRGWRSTYSDRPSAGLSPFQDTLVMRMRSMKMKLIKMMKMIKMRMMMMVMMIMRRRNKVAG